MHLPLATVRALALVNKDSVIANDAAVWRALFNQAALRLGAELMAMTETMVLPADTATLATPADWRAATLLAESKALRRSDPLFVDMLNNNVEPYSMPPVSDIRDFFEATKRLTIHFPAQRAALVFQHWLLNVVGKWTGQGVQHEFRIYSARDGVTLRFVPRELRGGRFVILLDRGGERAEDYLKRFRTNDAGRTMWDSLMAVTALFQPMQRPMAERLIIATGEFVDDFFYHVDHQCQWTAADMHSLTRASAIADLAMTTIYVNALPEVHVVGTISDDAIAVLMEELHDGIERTRAFVTDAIAANAIVRDVLKMFKEELANLQLSRVYI